MTVQAFVTETSFTAIGSAIVLLAAAPASS
jgi:hypothetical protein